MAFDPSTYLGLRPLLDEARRVSILTHIHPDGDGAGSALALTHFLRQRGLDARFILSSHLPPSLEFLNQDGREILLTDDAACSPFVRGSDLIFTVDSSAVNRMGPVETDVRQSKATRICIDHHLTHDDFWQINLIDQNACASGEMVHDLIESMGGPIDLPIAEALYVAIITDTGNFRFPRTSGKIHRMVARFLDLGVKPHVVYHQVHERHSHAAVRLLAAALLRIQYTAGNRLAWVEITRPLLAECRAFDEDTSDIIIQMLAVDGVEIALLLRQEAEGVTKVSWRSRPHLDVHALAKAHGGGGHRNAAGAVLDEPLESCSPRLVAEARAVLD
ncbi:MAG: bifunctional oligoribonuclease/PAP phosphatase NrnA [Acidobacteriota bacterium]